MQQPTKGPVTRTALEAGRAIAAGRLDPRALVEELLSHIQAHPDRDRIMTLLLPERARRAAAAAHDRAKRGLCRGPLDGVPISWKDLYDFAGHPSASGSRLRANHIASSDATVVRRADAAGLVPIGKTHMTELAFSGLGLNPMTATPPNPFDPARVAGGSSSGAAASVQAGFALAAMGSDTGGSIRIPAAWCGLTGFKPTHGLIPTDGVTPLSPSLDTVGPITRDVADAAALFSVLVGHPVELTGASLNQAYLAIPQAKALEGLATPIATAFEEACAKLAKAGARLVPMAAPECDEVLAIAASDGAIVNTEGWAIWGAAIEAQPEQIWPPIRARFATGKQFSGPQADGARLKFMAARHRWQARVAGFDAVLLPTTPIEPPLIAELLRDETYFTSQNLAALRLTRLANLLGLCAATLPLPEPAWAGLMLFGHPNRDSHLLRMAAACEQALRT